MRLLNTSTLQLHNFHDGSIPPYVIISHTWGKDEVVLQDLEKPSSKLRTGYTKISSCCALAHSEGWEYIWIDTCCIDKTSSAEISEAINSMYRWYKDAEVCYAYMVDVTWPPSRFVDNEDNGDSDDFEAFRQSRWFTRGWTLQELLAPESVVFFDRNWEEIGTKSSLQSQISAATNIPVRALADPTEASVAAKMSWAAGRRTTRVEDIAYCLMGLFDAHMPLLYGEGSKAFMRLQEMILRNTTDESLFAWVDPTLRESGMFARCPEAFSNSGDIIPVVDPRLYRPPSVMTNRGLEMTIHSTALIWKESSLDVDTMMIGGQNRGWSAVLLNCARRRSEEHHLFIRLGRKTENSYVRIYPDRFSTCTISGQLGPPTSKREYIEMSYIPLVQKVQSRNDLLIAFSPLNHGFSLFSKDYCMFRRIIKRDDLGGWQIQSIPDGSLLLFTNVRGETFVLEVKISEKHLKFKAFIPSRSGSPKHSKETQLFDLPEMRAFFDSTVETDRKSSVFLQAKSVLSIESRKKSLSGTILHMIEIKVLRHG